MYLKTIKFVWLYHYVYRKLMASKMFFMPLIGYYK